jgi:hypothetical protein
MSAAIVAQAGAGLFQFLQGLTSSQSAGSASNASSGATANASAGSLAVGGHHHKHGSGAFDKLANAITSALQSANSSGGTAADANQTITQALTKIFSNGSLGSTGSTASSAAGSSDTTDSTDSTDDTDASSSTGGLPAEFAKTLQSFGVTPQQFQTDLATALKSAQQSGSFDISNLFKSFPTGSVVDAVG